MQASEELLTIAELAIALAGFSGVVVAFGHQREFTAIDRLRFFCLLTISMAVVVMAFLPSVLHLLGISGFSLWRVSSMIFLVASVSYPIVLAPRLSRTSREFAALPPKFFRIAAYSLAALSPAVLLCNAVGWPYSPGAALFISALIVWLVLASMFFGILVLGRPSS
jgi:hypothetical protein